MAISEIEKLRKCNPGIKLRDISDAEFAKYGKVVEGYDFAGYCDYLEKNTPVPADGVYVASDKKAEELEVKSRLEAEFYGGMECQMGYCNGRNEVLTALEYHKGSELDVAVSPCVLILGTLFDMADGKISCRDLGYFYMGAGKAAELYATTLHYAPCRTGDAGFRVGIVLPKGTNEPIDLGSRRDPLLWMRNKWLIAHPEAEDLVKSGAYVGIEGAMPRIRHS